MLGHIDVCTIQLHCTMPRHTAVPLYTAKCIYKHKPDARHVCAHRVFSALSAGSHSRTLWPGSHCCTGEAHRHTHAVERVGLGTATSYVGATQRQVQRVWVCLDSTVLFCGCLGGALLVFFCTFKLQKKSPAYVKIWKLNNTIAV